MTNTQDNKPKSKTEEAKKEEPVQNNQGGGDLMDLLSFDPVADKKETTKAQQNSSTNNTALDFFNQGMDKGDLGQMAAQPNQNAQ